MADLPESIMREARRVLRECAAATSSRRSASAVIARALRERDERAARIARSMPIQIYRDEGTGPAGRSCKPATFDDVATAILSDDEGGV